MATLKEQIAADVQQIFFNLDEFGALHRIEGRQIVIIIDNDLLTERKNGQELGIEEADLLIFARSADLPPRKGPGSLLNFDGRECLIVDWAENAGIAEIALTQNRSM